MSKKNTSCALKAKKIEKKGKSKTKVTKGGIEKMPFHFIGIGGIGMSALARILLERSERVSGSDLSKGDMVLELEKMGAHVSIGHKVETVKKGASVIFSSGIKRDNPELLAARQKNCRLLHRSELLWELAKGSESIAIAGTHGKTTTSSLIAFILYHARLDPSFALGGYIPGLSNGKKGHSKYFVLEADESDGSFLNYHPQHAIVTNIECDHMEYFKTEKAVVDAFSGFISQVKKNLFYCGDDPKLKSMKIKRGLSYGFSKDCDVVIDNFEQKELSITFDLTFEKKHYKDIFIPLCGRHNALNGASVIALALKLGIPEKKIRAALIDFPGVRRRLEKKGEENGVLLYDDYAHHPTEIKSTLLALKRAMGNRRLIAVFQPHRYSRLSFHMEEFSKAFEIADELVVTDLYSAGEEPIHGVTAEKLVTLIKATSTLPCSFIPLKELASQLSRKVSPHDVIVTLGAGNLSSHLGSILSEIKKNPPKKYLVGLIFGGKSCEHEVSVRSARFVHASLNHQFYTVKCFGIDKEGGWVAGKEAEEILLSDQKVVPLSDKSFLSREIAKEIEACDLFYPALHGTFGEDGTIQGFFEMLGKPYAGPDFRSSSIAMDKVLTKKLLIEAGVTTPRYVTFTFREWVTQGDALIDRIQKEISLPVVVKPRTLGSSVGVNLASNKKELKEAIQAAFHVDTDVLVEERMENCREIEFPVIGQEQDDILVPTPGEKLAHGKIVDYEMKYSHNPVQATIEPHFDPKILKKGRELAKRAYLAIGIKGMARVDSLLDKKGNFWFFEVNTIPGMTSLSLFPKIWAREGIEASALIDKLILAGLARHRSQKRHIKALS